MRVPAGLASLLTWGAAALAAAVLVFPDTAWAHRIAYPKKDTIEIEAGRLVVSLVALVDEHDGTAEMRARYDRDRDGALDQDEAAALEQELAREARRTFSLAVDGRMVDLKLVSVSSGGIAGPLAVHEHVEVLARLEAPLTGTPSELVVSDSTTRGQRRVPVTVFARDLSLLANLGRVVEDTETGRSSVRDAFLDGKTALRVTLATRGAARQGNVPTSGGR